MLDTGDCQRFVTRFGHLFEHSPWVVERAWNKRPFADVSALETALMASVSEASEAEQLALIRAHPRLGVKQALTDASDAEQAGAGLQTLNTEEFQRFAALNAAYEEKFGFPFIICVGRKSKAEILAAFEERLGHNAVTEHDTALREIGSIARLRLAKVLSA
jgi:2-oxo-4-hydroxy-4-carboxy-5-ureidoimidazoline decarboxylase